MTLRPGSQFNPIQGSMVGGQASNPAANPEQDLASRYMMDLAQQMEAPMTPPPMANPMQQFLALLGANAGAHLLRRPGAAQPAIEAVEQERKKPEAFRQEQNDNMQSARQLRLQSMIRTADRAIKAAEAEGKYAESLRLQKEKDQFDMEFEGFKQKNRLAELEAKQKGDINLENQRSANDMKQIGARGDQARANAKFRSTLTTDKMAKWPEVMKREHSLAKAAAEKKYAQDKDADMYEARLQAIDEDFEKRDRALTGPFGNDRYGNKIMKSGSSSTQPAPDAAAGSKSTSSFIGRPGKPSSDPKISEATRKKLYEQGL